MIVCTVTKFTRLMHLHFNKDFTINYHQLLLNFSPNVERRANRSVKELCACVKRCVCFSFFSNKLTDSEIQNDRVEWLVFIDQKKRN